MSSAETAVPVSTPDAPHPSGVWRAIKIAALCASVLWIPYVVPGLEDQRVIGPGDGVPLADLLSATPRQGGAGLAGAFRRNTVVEQNDEALMAAAPLPEALPIAPAPATAPEPSTGPSSPSTPIVPPPARVDPEQYAGLTREIEDPHDAMRPFYARLARVSRGEPVLARMGVYGTSTNGADRMTSQLRRLLQEQFGDGGKGFVPVAPGWRFQRHQDVEWESERWQTFVVNRGDGPLDRYGYGGVVAINRGPGARATLGTVDGTPGSAGSVFRLFYQAWPGGGQVSLQVDQGEPRLLQTRAETVEDRVELIDVPDGPHELTIRAVGDGAEGGGDHDLRLYGVTMERDGPGVVVDGLALIGAFTRVLRLFDEAHLVSQVRARDPDLLVFWMGANDAVSESVAFVPSRYRGHYRGILRRFREANPDTACMVMSILDKGERVDGRIRTRPRVPRLVQVQREVALAEGCAFFDTYEAMGGEGTMNRWYRNRPRLVTDDLGHLTASGSRVMGTLLYRALLRGYDGWIAAGARAGSPGALDTGEGRPPASR